MRNGCNNFIVLFKYLGEYHRKEGKRFFSIIPKNKTRKKWVEIAERQFLIKCLNIFSSKSCLNVKPVIWRASGLSFIQCIYAEVGQPLARNSSV